MRKKFLLLLTSVILLVVCLITVHTGKRTTPTPTLLLEETNYFVEIHADPRTLKVGETITITAVVVGNFGNPIYSVEIKDQGISRPTLLVSLTPGNEITFQADASDVLSFVSANVAANQVTTVLQGHSPGVTEVFIAVNGEIGESDSSGHWRFNYVTKISEGLAITVVIQ